MTLSLITHGGVVALGYDTATNERGYLLKLINRTGASSVKGSLVTPSTSADREVVLQSDEYDTVGVVQEANIAQGQEMWTWMVGSICQVLMAASTPVGHGDLLLAASVDGRATAASNIGVSLPAASTHFKECGHFLQSASAGENVLALAILHFN